MSPRSSAAATLLFPRLPDDDLDTPLPISPPATAPQSTSDVLVGFVRRQNEEPPVKVYDLQQRRQAPAAEEMDAFQKVR